jgi:hypothetical protein
MNGSDWEKEYIPGLQTEVFPVHDVNGSLYCGTNGQGVFRKNANGWVQFTTYNSGLPGNIVYAITSDSQGYVWFGTDNGATRYDGSNWVRFDFATMFNLSYTKIYAIETDDMQNVWFGTPYGGMVMLDSQKQAHLITAQNSSLPDNSVYAIKKDKNNDLWIGTLGGLAKYNPGTKQWQTWKGASSGLPGDYIRGIALDDRNNVWVACGFSGVGRFDGTSWKSFNVKSNDLPSDSIWSISCDRKKKEIWIATMGRGICSLQLPLQGEETAATTGNHDFAVGPNPANTQTKLLLPENTAYDRLHIYNNLGQMITEVSVEDIIQNKSIDTTVLAQGSYYLRMLGAGIQSEIKRLLVIH